MQLENGYSYLYVTGDCHFVVSGNHCRVEADRHGIPMPKRPAPSPRTGTSLDGRNWSAKGLGVPPLVPEIHDAAYQWRDKLFAQGNPFDGAIRIVAEVGHFPPNL